MNCIMKIFISQKGLLCIRSALNLTEVTASEEVRHTFGIIC
jgi:hypothetical protein